MNRRYNSEEWKNKIDEWEKSNLTRKEFCVTNDLILSTFDYWRRRFIHKDTTDEPIIRINRTGLSGSKIILHVGHVFTLEILLKNCSCFFSET